MLPSAGPLPAARVLPSGEKATAVTPVFCCHFSVPRRASAPGGSGSPWRSTRAALSWAQTLEVASVARIEARPRQTRRRRMRALRVQLLLAFLRLRRRRRDPDFLEGLRGN